MCVLMCVCVCTVCVCMLQICLQILSLSMLNAFHAMNQNVLPRELGISPQLSKHIRLETTSNSNKTSRLGRGKNIWKVRHCDVVDLGIESTSCKTLMASIVAHKVGFLSYPLFW